MDHKFSSTLFLPFMNSVYERLAKPLAHFGLRMTVGALLVMEAGQR